MPLLPIDLQTLFSQSNQVGKEQAAQKEAAPLAQSLQGSQIAQRTEQRDSAVNEAHNQEGGPEQVKARGRRERERGRRQRKEPRRSEPPKPAQKDVFKDPALGRTIDITS